MTSRLRDLPGLGPASEQALVDVGIDSVAKLQELGAINAYLTLWEANPDQRPSLNFLYALVGALEGRSWLNVAQEDRYRLLMELEGFEELKKILDDS